VGDVRIKGLYIGVEFVRDRGTKEMDVDMARAVHFACLARGIVDIYDGGTNFLRWQPALTMPEDMFLRAAEILDVAIAEVSAGSR
jgi:4-aminobutyrate aminotransferase-like enzyme